MFITTCQYRTAFKMMLLISTFRFSGLFIFSLHKNRIVLKNRANKFAKFLFFALPRVVKPHPAPNEVKFGVKWLDYGPLCMLRQVSR